jgi:hypothetical protein
VAEPPDDVRSYIATEAGKLLETRAFVDGLPGFLLPAIPRSWVCALPGATDGKPSLSPPTPGAFIRNITDIVRIDALRVPQLAVVNITDEPALARIGCLRTGLVFLAPTKLRLQRCQTHGGPR